MSGVRAVIFDMDGVLTDSEWYIAEASRLMFRETHGVDIGHGDFSSFTGMGENRFLGGVAEKHGVTGFDVERDKARTYSIYADLVRGILKPLPGSIEFVYRCRELGLKTALATSADYTKVAINMEAIGLAGQTGPHSGFRADQVGLAAATEAAKNKAFDALVNAFDVQRLKPHPDLFLEAASRLEEEPAACWVVEDALSGIEAARAAGMRCLALLTTFTEDKIRAAGPDKIAKDLSAVKPEELLS